MMRPSRSETLRESFVNFTPTTRSSTVGAKIPMPGLQECHLMFDHETLNTKQCFGRETEVSCEPDWLQPKLRRHIISIDMDVRRLIRFMAVEIEAVRAARKIGGRARPPLAFQSPLVALEVSSTPFWQSSRQSHDAARARIPIQKVVNRAPGGEVVGVHAEEVRPGFSFLLALSPAVWTPAGIGLRSRSGKLRNRRSIGQDRDGQAEKVAQLEAGGRNQGAPVIRSGYRLSREDQTTYSAQGPMSRGREARRRAAGDLGSCVGKT
jgi:hypothetical protein